MSVNWQDSTSPARLKAHKAANVSGEFDSEVPTWDIYCDLREALIWALLMTGFPTKSQWQITESNWKQVFERLYILENTSGCRRRYNNGGNPSRDMWFTPEEVESMIGLSVNAGNKSDAEFAKMIVKGLKDDANGQFKSVAAREDDPYYWEKLHRPVNPDSVLEQEYARPVCNNL